MKKIFFLLTVSLFLVFVSCSKKDDDNDLPPQEIVTSDTSSITGELTVHAYYDGGTTPMNNVDIFLYVEYEDVLTDLSNGVNNLAIYRLYTGESNTAYFGYINYGNYYVLAMKDEAGTHYERLSIVQVRPRRDEHLNIFLIPTN
jgi:hypothetical protein